MGYERSEGYAAGFISGWNKCRSILCERYNLNEKEIIELEKSDELNIDDAVCEGDEK